jgi:hypothetical protein
MVKKCKVTGKVIESEKKWILPPHKLAEGYTTRKATCIAEGRNTGTCLICSETKINVLPIDKDAHLWKTLVLEEPTCSKKGKLLKICTLNDGHVVEEEIDTLEHVLMYNWEVVEPNCTDTGKRVNQCTKCGIVTEIIPINKDAHVFPSGIEWTPSDREGEIADCHTIGKEYNFCIKCNKDISRDVPRCSYTMVQHEYKAATCMNEGYIYSTCSECSRAVKEVLPIDKNAHIKSKNAHPVKQPTCYSEGLRAHTCTCGYVFDKKADGAYSVETTPHTVSDWVITKRPTCIEAGEKVRNCINENCNYQEKITMVAAHNMSSWQILQEATCVSRGLRTRFCYTCNDYSETEYYIGTHVPEKWYFKDGGSCKTGGTAYLKCKNCKQAYDEITNIKPGEHVGLTLVEDVFMNSAAGCSYKKYKCGCCGEEIKETLNHMWYQISPEIAPTCELPGQSAAVGCLTCFYKQPAEKRDPIGHDFIYDSDGTKYCLNCDLYYVNGALNGTCTHFCHNNGTIMKVLKKLCTIFWKFLGTKHFCECGTPHYHEESVKIISVEYDEGLLKSIKYSCEECRVKNKVFTFESKK